MKILFQGDSITDCGRRREDPHNLSGGYAGMAARLIREKYNKIDFEFLNLGIGGSQTKDLLYRLQSDFIDIQPDIVSIMIGINDVWHYANLGSILDNAVFEERYRAVLSGIKEHTNAKIMIIEPYLAPVEDKLSMRNDLSEKIEIIRKLARGFADVYMPTDGLINAEFVGNDISEYTYDGVHPTDNGAEFIAQNYLLYVSKIIDCLI